MITKPTKEQIERIVMNEYKRNLDNIITRLKEVGESCIVHARRSGKYNDITGNLRSSIGYTIIHDGEIVDLIVVEPTTGTKGRGEDGDPNAENLLKQIANEYSSGITLIVVAGMSYAVYIEAKEKDVLTSAEEVAREMLNDLKRDYK